MKSQSQRAYLWIHHPKVAKEFESKTPKGAKLPQYTKSDENAYKKMKGK